MSQARKRDVLRVAELRRRDLLVREVGGCCDTCRFADDELCAATDCSGDDAYVFAFRLHVAVNCRVRADVRGVDLAGEERLDGGGAGVEGLGCVERDVRTQIVLVGAAGDADDRLGVGDVREVAEAQGTRRASGVGVRGGGGGGGGAPPRNRRRQLRGSGGRAGGTRWRASTRDSFSCFWVPHEVDPHRKPLISIGLVKIIKLSRSSCQIEAGRRRIAVIGS